MIWWIIGGVLGLLAVTLLGLMHLVARAMEQEERWVWAQKSLRAIERN